MKTHESTRIIKQKARKNTLVTIWGGCWTKSTLTIGNLTEKIKHLSCLPRKLYFKFTKLFQLHERALVYRRMAIDIYEKIIRFRKSSLCNHNWNFWFKQINANQQGCVFFFPSAIMSQRFWIEVIRWMVDEELDFGLVPQVPHTTQGGELGDSRIRRLPVLNLAPLRWDNPFARQHIVNDVMWNVHIFKCLAWI